MVKNGGNFSKLECTSGVEPSMLEWLKWTMQVLTDHGSSPNRPASQLKSTRPNLVLFNCDSGLSQGREGRTDARDEPAP